MHWTVLTGEYPPQPGGVSDYVRLLAEELAATGDRVVVYAPPQLFGPELATPGVDVRRLPDRFGMRGLRRLDRELTRERPGRILVQFVPHAFGLKAMNVPFAAWAATRATQMAPVWVMFHEVASPFVRRPFRHNVLAVVNRAMARLLAAHADRIFVSIPSWASLLTTICRNAPEAEWLPIPSSVANRADPSAVVAVRSRYFASAKAPLVGHFGTFGRLITNLLNPSVATLMATTPKALVLFIGRGSERFRDEVIACHPALAGRLAATGELSAGELAAHLRACDLLLQPYPDGVTSRRTTVMAGLANGAPVVTNLGALSEPFWATSDAAEVVANPNPGALAVAAAKVIALAPETRRALGERGAELYRSQFSLERTIARLRSASPPRHAPVAR